VNSVDLKVPIRIVDEFEEDQVDATGLLDLASGDITDVKYQDYDAESEGVPAQRDDYEFTVGILSHDGKDVEFKVDVDRFSGRYSVSANELLDIKVKAAKLFAGIEGAALLGGSAAAAGRRGGRPKR
jgi:hypothetical protein